MSVRVVMWRVYAVLLLVGAIFSLGCALKDPGLRGTVLFYPGWILWLVSSLGVMGYAFGWRLVSPVLWCIVFALEVMVTVGLALLVLVFGAVIFGMGHHFLLGGQDLGPLFSMIAGIGEIIVAGMLLWHLPMLVALYRHGFRCKRFWRRPLARKVAPA